MIQQIIKELNEALTVPLLPYETNKIQDCVCYKYHCTGDNGAVAQYRLDLRIITKTIASAEDIRNVILQALITIGDNEKLGYKSCELNGGGTLKDAETATIHTLLYFDIVTKSEVSF